MAASDLMGEASRLLRVSLSDNTWRAYDSDVSSFNRFRVEAGLTVPLFPLGQIVL